MLPFCQQALTGIMVFLINLEAHNSYLTSADSRWGQEYNCRLVTRLWLYNSKHQKGWVQFMNTLIHAYHMQKNRVTVTYRLILISSQNLSPATAYNIVEVLVTEMPRDKAPWYMTQKILQRMAMMNTQFPFFSLWPKDTMNSETDSNVRDQPTI